MIAATILDGCSSERMGLPWQPPRWLLAAAEGAREIQLSRRDEGLALTIPGAGDSAITSFADAPVTYSDKIPEGWALLVTKDEPAA